MVIVELYFGFLVVKYLCCIGYLHNNDLLCSDKCLCNKNNE